MGVLEESRGSILVPPVSSTSFGKNLKKTNYVEEYKSDLGFILLESNDLATEREIWGPICLPWERPQSTDANADPEDDIRRFRLYLSRMKVTE